MHVIASLIISIVLSPFNWLIIATIGAIIFRKPTARKRCFIIAVIICIIFGNKWLLNLYAKKWQPSPVNVQGMQTYSCGIVPGGFASPDANGNGYFNSTSDRFIQVLKLYNLHKVSHILISGGNGKSDDKNFREGNWVKNELLQMNVPDSAVITEDMSDNTEDNAINARHLLDSLHLPPPYLLITSAMHVPRALLLFRNAGLAADAFPCNYSEGRDVISWSDFIPTFSVLSSWNGYFKEAAGYAWYSLKK